MRTMRYGDVEGAGLISILSFLGQVPRRLLTEISECKYTSFGVV